MCTLWLDVPKNILNPKLDKRVDEMIERGLLKELQEFRTLHKDPEVSDFSKGAMQAIGYKEFDEYFQLQDSEASTQSLTQAL